MCGQRAAVRFLSFPRSGTGMIGKNNGTPELVCEKTGSSIERVNRLGTSA